MNTHVPAQGSGTERPAPFSDTAGTAPGELAQLGLHELCAGWRGCLRAMRGTSTENLRLRMARLRALYVTELQRRRPIGSAGWAVRGPSSVTDPEPFLNRRSRTS